MDALLAHQLLDSKKSEVSKQAEGGRRRPEKLFVTLYDTKSWLALRDTDHVYERRLLEAA